MRSQPRAASCRAPPLKSAPPPFSASTPRGFLSFRLQPRVLGPHRFLTGRVWPPPPATPPAVVPPAWKDRAWPVQRLAPTPLGRFAALRRSRRADRRGACPAGRWARKGIWPHRSRASVSGSASTHVCCNGSPTGVTAGSAAVSCAGTTTTCRSRASIRRSCQGKPKPGSHPCPPPKIRLNSNAWITSESSSAYVSRLLMRVCRRVAGTCSTQACSAVAARALLLVRGRMAPFPHYAGRPDRPTGHDLAKAPQNIPEPSGPFVISTR